MAKRITLKETTLRNLLALKRCDESFSELVDRLVPRRGQAALERLRGSIEPMETKPMLADIAAKRGEKRFAER